MIGKRKVVSMIGSTKFQEQFFEEGWKFTADGWLVTLPNFRPESMMNDTWDIPDTELEDIGYHRINIADLVYVVNVNGYIGSSTAREIEYAKKQKKEIKYMVELD